MTAFSEYFAIPFSAVNIGPECDFKTSTKGFDVGMDYPTVCLYMLKSY